LDFERLVLFVTGMTNIRDVILFQEHQWMQNSKNSLNF
jgi:aspartyl/asparaginyl-tRNA synthetase